MNEYPPENPAVNPEPKGIAPEKPNATAPWTAGSWCSSEDVPQGASPDIHSLLDDLFTYHPPTLEQAEKYRRINEAARHLAAEILTHCPPCPDRTDAIRKVREARMTANAAIATKSGGRIAISSAETLNRSYP